jgi:hypothetical protein
MTLGCKGEPSSTEKASADRHPAPPTADATHEPTKPATETSPRAEAAPVRSAEFRAPQSVEDVVRLGFGQSTRKMHVVSNAKELLEVLDDDTTVVLSPGEYRVGGRSGVDATAFSAKLIGRDNLEVVGLGTPPPGLFQLAFEEPGLRLDRVSNVRLYNLSIGHDQTCMAPALTIVESRDVSAVGVDLYGSGTKGMEIISSNRLEIGHCRIHDCSHALSSIKDSLDVLVHDCVVEANDVHVSGLHIYRSNVEFRDVAIRDNSLSDTQESELFLIDSRARYDTAVLVPSRVRLERVTVANNDFSSLTNKPTQLELVDSTVEAGQFRNDEPPDDEPWWCACPRRADADAEASVVTRCWETHLACAEFEEALIGGNGPPDLLVAGLVQRCRHLGDVKAGPQTWNASEDGLIAEGGCFVPTPRGGWSNPVRPELLATVEPLPTGATRPWDSLAPFWRVNEHRGRVTVAVPPLDERAFNALRWDGLRRREEVEAGHSALPEELVDLGAPVLISSEGFESLEAFTSVRFDLSGGSKAWVLVYDRELRMPGLAIGGTPHPAARLRTEASREHIGLEHWAMSQARRMFVADPIVLPVPDHASWAMRMMEGRLPHGATRVVSVAESSHAPSYGVVFTVNADAETVQFVYQGESVRLHALVDLDGDGYDEILLSDGYEQHLVRLTESARIDTALPSR